MKAVLANAVLLLLLCVINVSKMTAEIVSNVRTVQNAKINVLFQSGLFQTQLHVNNAELINAKIVPNVEIVCHAKTLVLITTVKSVKVLTVKIVCPVQTVQNARNNV